MNYYDLLNVSTNSSIEQIKKGYRRAALIYHPDKNGDEKMFIKINRAYEVLTTDQRILYDRRGFYDEEFSESSLKTDKEYAMDTFKKDIFDSYKWEKCRDDNDKLVYKLKDPQDNECLEITKEMLNDISVNIKRKYKPPGAYILRRKLDILKGAFIDRLQIEDMDQDEEDGDLFLPDDNDEPNVFDF